MHKNTCRGASSSDMAAASRNVQWKQINAAKSAMTGKLTLAQAQKTLLNVYSST
jgi:hypothetical protein